MSRRSYFKDQDAVGLLIEKPGRSMEELIDIAVARFKPDATNLPRFRRSVEAKLDQASEEIAPQDDATVIRGTLRAVEDSRQVARGSTFVFTSAQANTHLHDAFWKTLMALVEDRNAELHVSRFTYNKARYGSKSVKPGSEQASDYDDLWYDPRIMPYVSDVSLQVADDLVWCGELNVIPTRGDPIHGFENYGQGASVIVPHVKMAMRSIPTMKFEEARFAYSTGTVTQRNYIETAVGQKANLHHVYGALLVEVDEDGTWWARQINATSDGELCDIGSRYHLAADGETVVRTDNERVEILTHGDLHGNKVDRDVMRVMKGVLERLRPHNQVFHDTVDFQPRNHHNIKDPHFLHQMFRDNTDNVEREFQFIGEVLAEYLCRKDSVHHVVTSNHDQAIEGWLRNVDGFRDPVNMRTWLEMNLYCADMHAQSEKPRPFWKMLSRYLSKDYRFNVVHEDDSLKIMGIENGLHGHLGPNGARGTPKNLQTAGKANTGHTHSAGIVNGVYTAGVFGKLDMGYNKGLSSWSHSFIITYTNGKRTICTIKKGKAWR